MSDPESDRAELLRDMEALDWTMQRISADAAAAGLMHRDVKMVTAALMVASAAGMVQAAIAGVNGSNDKRVKAAMDGMATMPPAPGGAT